MSRTNLTEQTATGYHWLEGTALLLLALSLAGVAAAATSTFNVTATVSSSISITQDTDLNFGKIVVIQDGTNTAKMVLNPDNTVAQYTPTGTENLIQIGSPTAGSYIVNAGVTQAVPIAITFPGSVSMAHTTASSGTFTVDAFTISQPTAGVLDGTTTTVNACNTEILTGSKICQFTSDANGLVTVPVGATLSVDDATATFVDGSYTGSFDLTATYY